MEDKAESAMFCVWSLNEYVCGNKYNREETSKRAHIIIEIGEKVQKTTQILVYIAICACASTALHIKSECVLECRDTPTSHCGIW